MSDGETVPSDLIPMYRARGGFNPAYVEARRIEAEESKPGRLFRQSCIVAAIGPRHETIAALCGVQLAYAVAMWTVADGELWRDQDYDKIERWLADGQPEVNR